MNAPSLRKFFMDHQADAAVRLVADTTASMRADAAFEQRPEDNAAGALLADEAPATLSAGALDAILSRIDETAALDEAATRHTGVGRWADELAQLPSPLREAALEAVQRSPWEFVGFGIRRLPLMNKDGSFAELMRVEPGHGVAHHDHADDELTLIVTGGYHDGHAHYGAGDLSLAQPGFIHDPKADPDEVCYLLAVTYGPAKFQGGFGLLQKVMGLFAGSQPVWRTS